MTRRPLTPSSLAREHAPLGRTDGKGAHLFRETSGVTTPPVRCRNAFLNLRNSWAGGHQVKVTGRGSGGAPPAKGEEGRWWLMMSTASRKAREAKGVSGVNGPRAQVFLAGPTLRCNEPIREARHPSISRALS